MANIKGVFMFTRIVNIITGLGLIIIAIFAIINIFNLITFKVFLIPSPIFIGFFGFVLIGLQVRIKFVIKNMNFLTSFLGRGLFNIYLSSVAFWFLQDSQVLAWISAIILFITGIMYVVFHCGYAKELRKQYEEEAQKFQLKKQEQANPIIRENLM